VCVRVCVCVQLCEIDCPTMRQPRLDLGCSARHKTSLDLSAAFGYDPGIESRWEARFSAPVQTGPEVHPASYPMGTRSFPGVKRPGRDADHPPHLAPRLKKE